MFFNLPAALACLVLLVTQRLVLAHSSNPGAVHACGIILRDLPEDLASSFCSSYAGIKDITSTCTETKTRSITISSSASCSAASTAYPSSWTSASPSSATKPQPGSISSAPTSTQSSVFPIRTETSSTCNALCTVTASSAVIAFVTETAVITSTVKVPKRQKRIPAAFCPEVGVPCLMAGMDSGVITEGCLSFVMPHVAETKTKIVKTTSTIFAGATCAAGY